MARRFEVDKYGASNNEQKIVQCLEQTDFTNKLDKLIDRWLNFSDFYLLENTELRLWLSLNSIELL